MTVYASNNLLLNLYMIYLIVYFHRMAEYFMSMLRLDSETFSIKKARACFFTLYTLLVLYICGDILNIYLYLLRGFPNLRSDKFDLNILLPLKLSLECLRLILPIFLGIFLMLLLSFFAADAQLSSGGGKVADEDSNDQFRATGFRSYSNDNNSEGPSEIPNSM